MTETKRRSEMFWINRWKMSVWILWLWLKVTPDCPGKDDIVRAVAGAIKPKATIEKPRRNNNDRD